MSPTKRRAPERAALTFPLLVAALLVVAPLFRAGNRPLPLLALELLALAVFAAFALHRVAPWAGLNIAERSALILLPAIPLLALIPLPAAWWAALPGHALYADALTLLGDTTAWRGASLVPWSTQASALALLPVLAVFLATRACSQRQRARLVFLVLALATLQAFLGLIQYGTQDPLLYLGMEPAASAVGTYPNRNHFAGLFEMAFPLAAALFAANFGHDVHAQRRYHGHGLRAVVAALGSAQVNRYLVFMLLLVLFGLAVVFSRSRTGITLLIVGIVVSALAFAPRLGGRQSLRTVGGVMVLLLGGATAVGLVPVLERFTQVDAIADSRWSIAQATINGIGTFFPFGAGQGTFPEVFRRFHPGDVPLFVNSAHNDYLEWLFDGGALAGLAIVLVAALIVLRVVRTARMYGWPRDRYLRIGAALGIGLIALHSLVDYNLRIPANAILFAFLLGLLFAPEAAPAEHRVPPRSGWKAESDDGVETAAASATPPNGAAPAAAPLEPDLAPAAPNPFAL